MEKTGAIAWDSWREQRLNVLLCWSRQRWGSLELRWMIYFLSTVFFLNSRQRKKRDWTENKRDFYASCGYRGDKLFVRCYMILLFYLCATSKDTNLKKELKFVMFILCFCTILASTPLPFPRDLPIILAERKIDHEFQHHITLHGYFSLDSDILTIKY